MGQARSKTQFYFDQAAKLLDNAVVENDADALHDFLQEGVFTSRDLDECYLLHHAAMLGHVACVQVLLEFGVEANVSHIKYGMTPLHFSVMAEENTSQCIYELLKYGAKLHSMGGVQCAKTPLHVAVEYASDEAVIALVQFGCGVNIPSECSKGISPLLTSIQEGKWEIMRILLEAGADLRKCWIWKSAFAVPMDILTYEMAKHRLGGKHNHQANRLLYHGHVQVSPRFTKRRKVHQQESPALSVHKFYYQGNISPRHEHRLHCDGSSSLSAGVETKEEHVAQVSIFRLLLQADGNLTMTLCQMPQGQTTKVGAVRTFNALQTILRRLDSHFRKLAREFVMMLVYSGYVPRGDAKAFLRDYDPFLAHALEHYFQQPRSLRDTCVKLIRKRLRFNVLYGVNGLEKLTDDLRDLIAMTSFQHLDGIQQPSLPLRMTAAALQ